MTFIKSTGNEFAARRQHYELLRQAVRAYGFAPGAMVRIGSGYRVEGPAGPRFLKRLNYGPPEASFIYHALEHLRRTGFAEAPRMHLTTDGLPFIVPDGEIYYLQDWHDLSDPDLGDPSVLGGCVDLMARLHRAGEGFEPPGDIADVRNDYGSWLDKCVGRLREMYSFAELAEERKRINAFDGRYARASLYFARQAEEAVRRLAELPLAEVAQRERQAKALCHRDFTPRNLGLDARSKLRVFDFDNVAREVRLDDLAKFIRRAAYLDVDRAAFIVERYGRETGRALSSEEIALLSAYLLFPTEFWSVGNSRFRKDRPREHRLRRLIRDSEAWASFAEALADLNVPRSELSAASRGGWLSDAPGGAPGSMLDPAGEGPEGIALPEGPYLPSVPFAEGHTAPAAVADTGLVRFDRPAAPSSPDQEEVVSTVPSTDSWNCDRPQEENTGIPVVAHQDPADAHQDQGDEAPEEQIWVGAELPEGAEPWVDPIASGGDAASDAPGQSPPVSIDAGVEEAIVEADAEPQGPEAADDYVEARRGLITSATTIVWGKWPKPMEKASSGGQQG